MGFVHAAGFAAARRCLRFLVTITITISITTIIIIVRPHHGITYVHAA